MTTDRNIHIVTITMKHQSQVFDPNEKKVLFALALLLCGERALAFRSIVPAAPHRPLLHSHRWREDRLGGRSPPSRRRVARSNDSNVALSMSMSTWDSDDALASELELRREFEEFDASRTGAISKADVVRRLPFVPTSIIEMFFSMADTNSDGTIDFEEYKAAKREMSVSPRLRLFQLLNLPIVEIANALAIVLCSFLVAVSTIQSLPEIPIPAGSQYDFVRSLLQDRLHLILTRDGSGVEAIVLINATLSWFNYIFAVDFFVRWWCADNFRPRHLVRPLSVLDIVVVLIPLALQQFYPFLTVYNSPGLQNLLLLRILRLRRVLADIGTFSRFEMALGLGEGDVRPYQLQLARVLLSVFTLLSVASGLIYATEHGVNPDIPDYFSALYFGLTTLTTVGFGDIAPVTPGGRLVVSCAILLGVAVIPAQAASLVDAILAYQNEEKAKQSSSARPEVGVSLSMNMSTDAAEDNSPLRQRPAQEAGLVGAQTAGLDHITTEIPNSQVIKKGGSTIQVKQILRFSNSDIDKVPKVLSDVQEEIKARCPEIIYDGSQNFAAAMASFEAGYIETQVNCHFSVQPGSSEYLRNKGQVLLAIASAMDKNDVAFAIPETDSVNEEP